MSKKFLIVYHGDTPECVEGFKEGCVRSSDYKGAIHVNPGKQLTVTEDELAHIKSKYSHMSPKLRVVSEMKVQAAPKAKENAEEKAEAQSEAQPEALAPAQAAPEHVGAPDAQGSSKAKKKS